MYEMVRCSVLVGCNLSIKMVLEDAVDCAIQYFGSLHLMG